MITTLKSIEDVLIGESCYEPNEIDLNEQKSFKFVTLEYARKNSGTYVNRILDLMPIRNDRRYVLVDVKVHALKAGDYPALTHWHIDATSNPYAKGQEEHNHLFVSGEYCCTEFLKNRIDVDIPTEGPIKFNSLLKNCESAQIKGNTIYTYGRVPHRATKCIKDFTRLLVRVTETDIMQSSRKEFIPTHLKGK